MAVEKWASNPGWTAVTISLNSLANGSAIMAGADIDNSANLDIFMDIQFALASAAFVSPAFLGVYLYPLNQDGVTYGDGRFTSAAAAVPPASYYAAAVKLVQATQAQVGGATRIIIPPGIFRPVVFNQGGVALAGSGNSMYYRPYNRQIA